MLKYTFVINYHQWSSTATRELRSYREAEKWAQLCLDICGKDENGNSYVTATLTCDSVLLREYDNRKVKINNPWMNMFVHSDNKKFKIRRLALSLTEANAFCAMNPDCGLIGTDETSAVHIIAELNPTQ